MTLADLLRDTPTWLFTAIGLLMIAGLACMLTVFALGVRKLACLLNWHDWTTFKRPPMRECIWCNKRETL